MYLFLKYQLTLLKGNIIITLTKADIIKKIRNNSPLSAFNSTIVVDKLLEIIKKLESGEDVLISESGKISVKEKRTPGKESINYERYNSQRRKDCDF